MFRKLKAFLLYEDALRGDLKSVQAQVREENRKFAIIWSIFQLLYWSFCLFMSTRNPDYNLCRNAYIFGFSICAVTLLLATLAAPDAPWLIKPIAIAVDVAILGAGIGVAQFMAPKTIILFASVLLVPVFFICNSLTTLCILALNAVAFVIIGKIHMEPEIYSWTLTNLLIFSSIGLFLGFFVNKARFERYLYADTAVRLAELQTRYAYYDQMTGLKNRRAYSEVTDGFMAEMPPYCCTVMVDVNSLKETNDKLGHEAGDELISAAAECLCKGFDGAGTAYRIGGDEFCVLLTDPGIDIAQCLKQVEECCAGWKGKYVNGISVAYGYADSTEFPDYDSMRKEADHRMYQFKRDYYIRSGKDRRRR